MTTELLLPEGVASETGFASVRERLSLRADPATGTERTFYDTFDGLLRGAGLIVVHADGRMALLELDGMSERASIELAERPERILAIELGPSILRDALVDVVDVRALLARARVRTREQRFGVLDGEQKTVVRLAVQQPAVLTSEHRSIALSARVSVHGVRGYDAELRRTARMLELELGFARPKRPLFDEAVIALGGDPRGTSSKLHVKLARKQRADAAAALVLRALLSVIEANIEGVVADIDAESLHDFRVAIRRTRAVLRELKRVFPPAQLAVFRDRFRSLQRATGDARDLDVYVLGFPSLRALVPGDSQDDLDPLLGVLRSRRLTARREMVRTLRAPETRELLAEWGAFLHGLVAEPADDRPDATEPIAEIAGGRIVKVYGQMVKMGGAIDDSSPAQALHELRKKGKELRYLLELFAAPIHPEEVVKPMVKSLKALQDVLGRHQDRAVQVSTLRGISGEVSALPGGDRALMAMGLLIERVGRDQDDARDELAAVFATFASKAQRKLVKETFA